MGFSLQLRLLLWKNFTLRKRQKIRLVIEILWPLLLFLILMWVRTRGLKEHIPECHFVENALPTAGWPPALRSYVCNINNKCYHQAVEKDVVNTFNSSLITKFLFDVEKILKKHIDIETLDAFENFIRDLTLLQMIGNKIMTEPIPYSVATIPLNKVWTEKEIINKTLEKRNSLFDEKDISEILSSSINLDGLKMVNVSTVAFMMDPSTILCNKDLFHKLIIAQNKDELEKVRNKICQLSSLEQQNAVVDMLKNANASSVKDQLSVISKEYAKRSLKTDSWIIAAETVSKVSVEIQKLDSLFKALEQLRVEITSQLRPWENMNSSEFNILRLMCGTNMTSLFQERTSEFPLYLEDIRNQVLQNMQDKSKFVYDNTTTEECNFFIRNFETNKKFRFLWKQVNPFIRGKILYYPDKIPVRDVMERVNGSFAFFLDLLGLITEWKENISPGLRTAFIINSPAMNFWKDVTDPANLKKNALINETVSRILHSYFVKERLRIEDKDIEAHLSQLHVIFNTETLASLRDNIKNADEWAFYIHTFLKCFEFHRLEPFNSVPVMMDRALQLINESRLWAAIEFMDPVNEEANNTLKPHVVYKIRMDTNKVDDTKQIEDRIPRPGSRPKPPLDLKYMQFGFIHLQDLIERAIIEVHTQHDVQTGIWMQQFPYPCYINDRFIVAISRSFPMFMTLAWVYTAAMLIRNIVYEKEQRLKEMMRMMGLGNAVHWIGWFISSIIVLIVIIFLLTIILKYGKVIEFSNPVIIFLFLLCYALSTITLSFLISTWFSKANLAAAAGGIIFFVVYLPYPLLVRWNELLTRQQKFAFSILSNVAFGFGCSYFAQFEEMGIGVQWSNVANSSNRLGFDYTLTDSMIMMLIDSIFYMILTTYIETVAPGEYGVPKPWYFFVTKTYWFGSSPKNLHNLENEILTNQESVNQESDFEQEPTHLQLGIQVKNMSKIYKGGKMAVNNLTLNFYEDQITSFLGHNGAGKTTTISILTGMIPPTYGTAYVYGIDIRSGMDEIRTNLGMCPQYNILFNFLTVEEHLWFYAGLKANKLKDTKGEIDQMISDLGLLPKRHALASTLSGGMQRKLSISIAFIAGSKTVILDEPTAGVDPYSRRSIWELLIKYKKGKTIILTTHYMDEADLLGDRIAIIANGKLRCCGSSLFLKSQYGRGYYLTVVKEVESSPSEFGNSSRSEEDEGLILEQESVWVLGNDLKVDGILKDSYNSDTKSDYSNNDSAISSEKTSTKEDTPVGKLIRRHIPDAKLVEDVGLETTYILPVKNLSGDGLENLLKDLDRQMKYLKLNSYGISDTNLEEVFLKVANSLTRSIDDLSQGKRVRKPLKGLSNCFHCRKLSTDSVDSQIKSGPRVQKLEKFKGDYKGVMLLSSQFHALIAKRSYTRLRNIKGLFTEIILPALFVCLALLFTLIIPPLGFRPPLELSPWLYGPPNYIFYRNVDSQGKVPKRYEEALIHKPYLGTRCINSSPKSMLCSAKCDPLSYLFDNTTLGHENFEACDCTLGTPVCSKEQIGPSPPMALIATEDYLVNMTGRDISNWIVKTEAKYYKKRYGGYSLGLKNPLSNVNMTHLHELFDRFSRATNVGRIWLQGSKQIFGQFDDGLRSLEAFDNIKVWFNNQGWASSVAYLNAMNNILLRTYLSKDKDPMNYGITVINHPVNMTGDELVEEIIRRSSVSLLQAICIIFALSFVPASFVLYLIDERISKFKHLQFVSGVKQSVYWIINFLWDMLNYSITAILCILIFLAFREEAFVSGRNFFPLCCLLIFYGWACIPLMYPVSFVINVPSAAFVALGCGNLFIGIVTTVTTFTLEIMNDKELQNIADILKNVFLIFPHYCLGRGVMDMATNQLAVDALDKLEGLAVGKEPFAWNFLGKNLFAMSLQGAVCFAFTLLLEYNVFKKLKFWQPRVGSICVEDDDDDVAKERQRITTTANSNAVVRVENLTKVYSSGVCASCKCGIKSRRKNIIAVRSLCFEVQAGECFGLLGINGAGKTSTFKMLTGDTSVSRGNAVLCGHNILTEMNEVRKNVGYCPQFDALHNLLTGREHLVLFARLRGIPSYDINRTVNNVLQKLGLTHLSDKLVHTYSGGNKRKLSTAIALIGEPQIIFLDEPTTGMDPKSKRFLWNCILDLTKEGKSIILTSHSMEECEALCSRLAIMVNGQFKCLGSIQHLKNKYGSGYLVTARINLKVATVDQFINYFQLEFPSALLTEQHHNQVQFQISQKDLQLSFLFNRMEFYRNIVGIEDYSITQTTLDQVFVNFAKHQKENAEEISATPISQRFIRVPKSMLAHEKNGRAAFQTKALPHSVQMSQFHIEGEIVKTGGPEETGTTVDTNTFVESTDL